MITKQSYIIDLCLFVRTNLFIGREPCATVLPVPGDAISPPLVGGLIDVVHQRQLPLPLGNPVR